MTDLIDSSSLVLVGKSPLQLMADTLSDECGTQRLCCLRPEHKRKVRGAARERPQDEVQIVAIFAWRWIVGTTSPLALGLPQLPVELEPDDEVALNEVVDCIFTVMDGTPLNVVLGVSVFDTVVSIPWSPKRHGI